MVWRDQSWSILHDNAPAHKCDVVQNYLRRFNISQIPYPGYSPDLSPPDYWIFARLKALISGQRYHTLDDLKVAIDNAIQRIPQQEFAQAMAHYPERLCICIAAQGSYFERK